MNGDIFKLEIRLDAQSMTELGGHISNVCCEFPAMAQAEAVAIFAALSVENPDMALIKRSLERLAANAGIAIRIGNGMATLFGMHTPERIDGGPVQ